MSSLVTVTLPHEGEQQEEEDTYDVFSFDEWIIENGLEAIKQILIKHNANTLSTLKFDAAEFQTVVIDTQLLTTKAHMLPKLMNAVHNISKIVVTKVVTNVVHVTDDEQEVIDL
eukprot:888535_1